MPEAEFNRIVDTLAIIAMSVSTKGYNITEVEKECKERMGKFLREEMVRGVIWKS